MIFYFSGTGNSLYSAKRIAEHNNEKLISIASEFMTGKNEFTLSEDELIGFVFPVYAWGPPPIVTDFIKKLKLNNYAGNYIFTVITCGAEIGNAADIVDKVLKKKGLKLNSAFSVQMPSNYMIMGDVDSEEDKKIKLESSEKTIKHISEIVGSREQGIFELERGAAPGLKTAIVSPMFSKFAVQPKKFYADENCTGCGVCETVCCCDNIKISGKPIWGNRCTQCLACINYCPAAAIQFGKSTLNKGRYTNPNIKPNDISAAKKSLGG